MAAPRTEREPQSAWIALTVLAAALGIANGVGAVAALFDARWLEAIVGAGGVLALYWFAAGAWLRTPWADVSASTPPPDPPPLSSTRARLYIVIAAGSALAAALALAVQALAAAG
jgi:arginine exporter protein ArgO